MADQSRVEALLEQVLDELRELRDLQRNIDRLTVAVDAQRKATQASADRELITNEHVKRIARGSEDVAVAHMTTVQPMALLVKAIAERLDVIEAIREATNPKIPIPPPDRAVTLAGMADNMKKDRFYTIAGLAALAIIVGGLVVVYYLVHK